MISAPMSLNKAYFLLSCEANQPHRKHRSERDTYYIGRLRQEAVHTHPTGFA